MVSAKTSFSKGTLTKVHLSAEMFVLFQVSSHFPDKGKGVCCMFASRHVSINIAIHLIRSRKALEKTLV